MNLPTKYGTFRAYGFVSRLNGEHHIALVKGDIGDGKDIPVSYTHLDVYKRQHVRSKTPKFSFIGGLYPPDIGGKVRLHKGFNADKAPACYYNNVVKMALLCGFAAVQNK